MAFIVGPSNNATLNLAWKNLRATDRKAAAPKAEPDRKAVARKALLAAEKKAAAKKKSKPATQPRALG